jgi:hypothetical protein
MLEVSFNNIHIYSLTPHYTILLYYILPYYYTTIPLYHYTTILLYYYTTIPLYHYTTILPYYHTTIPLYIYYIGVKIHVSLSRIRPFSDSDHALFDSRYVSQ